MITHLEPDILECRIKLALGSITTNKAREGDGISVELFEVLKGQFSFQSQRKAMPNNVQTTTQLHSSHTLAK